MTAPQNATEFLTGIRTLLSSPEKWTRGQYARDERGDPVAAISPRATCHCMVGAALVVREPMPVTPKASEVTEAVARAMRDSIIELFPHRLGMSDPSSQWSLASITPTFNDHPDTTHDDVLKVLDRSIERLTP